jgi:RNA polymerase sigma-70 factor (ECF subfamily)
MGSKQISTSKELPTSDDSQLVSRLVLGESDALTAMFQKHREAVLRVAIKVVRDREEAEEVIQRVFLEIYRCIRDFDPQRGSFKGWLLGRAFSRAMDRRKHLKARRFYFMQEIEASPPTEKIDTLFHLSVQEQQHLIGQLLALLSTKERFVIEMKFFTGLTVKEIADQTQESVSSVASVLYRALRTMHRLLAESGDRLSSGLQGPSGRDKLLV